MNFKCTICSLYQKGLGVYPKYAIVCKVMVQIDYLFDESIELPMALHW